MECEDSSLHTPFFFDVGYRLMREIKSLPRNVLSLMWLITIVTKGSLSNSPRTCSKSTSLHYVESASNPNPTFEVIENSLRASS